MSHLSEFWLLQIFKTAVLALPLKSAQRLGDYLGLVAFHCYGSRRRIALENLRSAFPDKSEAERAKIAKGAFRNYGIALVELLWFPNLTDKSLRHLVAFRNLDLMKTAEARGKGLVMLSGHFGNWELIALATAHASGYPITIIVREQSNKRVSGLLDRHRCLFGNRVVSMGQSVREIIRTLSEGKVVAMAPDQSAAAEGAFVDFFGRSVATHRGPALFAIRAGAPVLMGFIMRKPDWTYDVVLEEVKTDDLAGNSDDDILELTRRHTALLEKYIRQYPDHWLWMHRRWKHTAPSGSGIVETNPHVDV